MGYSLPNHDYAWAEYLKLEAESEERYEYHDGEIVAMAGATNRHNMLVPNLIVELKPASNRKGCQYYAESVKLFRFRSDRYLYPDGIITCNPLDLQTKNGVRNPLLVVEVISDGSSKKDHSFKMRAYFKMPSLRHYLLVEQVTCLVMHYRRHDSGLWDVLFYDEPDQVIEIPKLGVALSLSALYAGIEFGPEVSEAEEAAAWYGVGEEEG